MRRLVVCAVAAATCALLAGPAQAVPITYFAGLSGANENPSNLSTGSGFAEVIIDVDANTLEITVSFSDLLAPTTVAHIHCCTAAPGNVGVATTTPTFPGFPAGVTSGFYHQVFDLTLASTYSAGFLAANGGTPEGAEAALAAGLAGGLAYMNVHSQQFPAGEIRGFLAAVPEPGTLMLLGLGLAGLAGAKWSRDRRLGGKPHLD